MAESIQQQIDNLEQAVSYLEHAVPLIVTPSRRNEGLQYILQAADFIKDIPFDEYFGRLATAIKMITNGESPILSTVTFQGFIVDLLESLSSLLEEIRTTGPPKETDSLELLHVAEFLIRLAGRVTTRYKINVFFEPEYEAKSLRAFMVLKELEGVVRFLDVSPDISENQNANLDNGLEIDCLSQESPERLHQLVGSVLEVQSVQIFKETKPQPVQILDPPDHPDSFDRKISDFINK